uniref:hypothetical protein n=1 Tax=Flavobacterium sp. TaxID=239 RepID=UPI001598281E|nr:hypothetical protein [Flavobacterium sp.]QJS06631.1 hypothetical protein [Flavobacterium sp.]
MVHTLILSAKKFILPKAGQCKLVLSLIRNNEIEIDYFGMEIDNSADYQDEEMELKIKTTSFINFFFEDNEIEYSKYSKEEILKLAENLLSKSPDMIVSEDNKDIDLYI